MLFIFQDSMLKKEFKNCVQKGRLKSSCLNALQMKNSVYSYPTFSLNCLRLKKTTLGTPKFKYISVHMCRCWESTYIAVVWRSELVFNVVFCVFFSPIHLQMCNLIYIRSRKTFSLLLAVTLPDKRINQKFFRILCFLLTCFFLYIHFACVLGIRSVSERISTYLPSRQAQCWSFPGKMSESPAPPPNWWWTMWEWGSSSLTLVIRDVGFSTEPTGADSVTVDGKYF